MVQFPSGAHQSLLEISERDFCCMYYALAHPCNTFVQNAMEMGKIRTKEEYENTVGKGLDNTIYKKRYQFEVDDLTYAVDIFEGELEGLAYLEIEFESEKLANSFETPDWIIKDVTNDRRFKNQELAQFGMPKIN